MGQGLRRRRETHHRAPRPPRPPRHRHRHQGQELPEAQAHHRRKATTDQPPHLIHPQHPPAEPRHRRPSNFRGLARWVDQFSSGVWITFRPARSLFRVGIVPSRPSEQLRGAEVARRSRSPPTSARFQDVMRGLLTTISATLMDCASNSFWNELAWDHHTGARARHERQTGFASPERLGFADCEPSQLVPEFPERVQI